MPLRCDMDQFLYVYKDVVWDDVVRLKQIIEEDTKHSFKPSDIRPFRKKPAFDDQFGPSLKKFETLFKKYQGEIRKFSFEISKIVGPNNNVNRIILTFRIKENVDQNTPNGRYPSIELLNYEAEERDYENVRCTIEKTLNLSMPELNIKPNMWSIPERMKPEGFSEAEHKLVLENRDILNHVLDFQHGEGDFPTENRLKVEFLDRKDIVSKLFDLELFESPSSNQGKAVLTFGGFLYCNNETMKNCVAFMDRAFPSFIQNFKSTYGESELDFEELIQTTNPRTWNEFKPLFQKALILLGKAGRYLITPTIQTLGDGKVKLRSVRVSPEILDYPDIYAFFKVCFISMKTRLGVTTEQNMHVFADLYTQKPFDRRPSVATSHKTQFISQSDIEDVQDKRLKAFLIELNKCYSNDCPNAAGGLVRAILSSLVDIYYLSKDRFDEVKNRDLGNKLGKLSNEDIDRNVKEAIKHLRANAKLLGDAVSHSLSALLQTSDVSHSQGPLKILLDFVLRETKQNASKG